VALAERQIHSVDDARASRPFVEHDHSLIASAIMAGNHRRARSLTEDHVQHIISVLEAEGLDPDGVVEWT
jgi:DNA-binding GntR family transcriptional regulator